MSFDGGLQQKPATSQKFHFSPIFHIKKSFTNHRDRLGF